MTTDRPLPASVTRSTVALVAAVLSFYVGQWVGFGIKWGSFLQPSASLVMVWLIVAALPVLAYSTPAVCEADHA